MRRFLWIVILSLSAATLPAEAGAGRLTIEDVRGMAFDKGIATIKEIELDDDGPRWEIDDAVARDGKRYDVELDPRTLRIVRRSLDN